MPSRIMPRLAGYAALMAALLVNAPARGQIMMGRNNSDNPNQPQQPDDKKPNLLLLDGEEGKEMLQGTTIKDSEDAFKKIRDAQRMESLKDWAKAAEWYQEVLQSRDKLVPLAKDKHDFIYQYTSVRRAAMLALSKWPPEGLQAYRNLYEAAANTLLQATKPDDAVTLENIFQDYFVTEPGKQAGIQLINLYLESGEFTHAIRIADLLLDMHPNLMVERPQVLYLDGLAAHWIGDDDKAKSRLKELQDKYAGTTGVLFGKDTILADALTRDLQNPVPSNVILSADSYPTIGGDASRSAISAAGGRPGALIARIEYAGTRHKGNSPQEAAARAEEIAANNSGQTIGVIPAVDRGELYFQDGLSIYAVDLESGLPLPGWMQTYGADRRGRYTISRGEPAQLRTGEQTITLTENAVYAVLGFPARAQMIQNQMGNFQVDNNGNPIVPTSTTRLVCLDRATGKEKWSLSPRQLPDKEHTLANLDFSGAPLVVGNRVYTLARGGADMNSDNCFVVCLDADTGQCLWSSFVASSDDSAAAMYGQYNSTDTTSHLAYGGGRVFVLSNLGAIAALDAYTGSVAWLDLYPRNNTQTINPNNGFGGGVQRNASQTRPWAANPIIVADDKIFALPSDGTHLLIYDAGTGVELRRIRLSKLQNATQLLAVFPDHLVLVGAAVRSDGTTGDCVLGADWTKDGEGDEESVLWLSVPEEIVGRPFVTRDNVFVSCGGSQGCLRVATGTGTIPSYAGRFFLKYPSAYGAYWSESEGEGPGNVIVTADQVIVAGATSVNIYADLGTARAKLDREIADRPNEPKARLRYAEVMFAAGQPDLMLGKLTETINLLGGRDALHAGDARDRLFNDTLTFAQKLGKQKTPENIALCEKLFDIAAFSANSPQQQVSYRTTRARFDRDITQREQAVKLYQEVLASASLRNVTLLADDGSNERAASLVEREIGKVIDQHPEIYAPYETRAAILLQAAQKANNADAMIEVAEAYPNSTSATPAMIAAADSYEAAGKARQAIQVLGQASRARSGVMVNILEAMARNKLNTPMPGGAQQAAGILLHAARQMPTAQLSKPMKLPDGTILQNISLGSAAEAVKKFADQSAAHALPDIHIPGYLEEGANVAVRAPMFKPDTTDTQIDGIDAIITPPYELRDTARNDRIVTWSKLGVVVYPAGKTNPLWSNRDFSDQPAACSWSGEDLLVWNGQQIALLDGASGKSKWVTNLKSLGSCEVVSASGGSDSSSDDAGATGIAQANGPDGQEGDVGIGQVGFNGNNARILMIQRMQIARMRAAAGQPQPPVADPAAASTDSPAVETIGAVSPVWDRIQLTSSTGRVVSLDAGTGQLAWQTRLADRPVEQLIANNDFTVVRYNDDSSSHLYVLDTLGMQVVFHQAIPLVAPPQDNGICNAALAPDGTLVWTTPDHLMGKYLYLAKSDPTFDYTPAAPVANGQVNNTNHPYEGGKGPDALLIAGDKIVVMEQGGRFVSLHSLIDGSVLDPIAANGRQSESMLMTGCNDWNWNCSLQLAGNWIYAIGPHSLLGYDLDHAGVNIEGGGRGNRFPVSFKSGLLTQSAVVVVDEPTHHRPVNGTLYRLFIYSREPVPESTSPFAESGMLTGMIDVTEQAGIHQWTIADGGVYYLSGDNKLHFLQGSK